MKTIGSLLSSEAQRSERASERTDAPSGAQQTVRDLEFRLREQAKELRSQLAGLSDTSKARHVEAKKRQRLAAILAKVEKRILNIRQMRLF